MEKHSRIIICLATILLLGAPTAHGERLKAKIEFKPKTVVPLVTLRSTTKCALVPADSSDEDDVLDVKSVVGVSIKQKNTDGDFETVASVSYSDPDDPKLYGNWDDNETAVDAHLDEYSSLLEVTVTDPTVKHTGDMLCEIFVNDGEAVETLSSQDTIGYQEPNMKIFLSELRRLKLENEDQQQETVLQIDELQKAKGRITDLETKESTKVAFTAVRDNGQYTFWEDVSDGTDLVFNKALINQGGDYDTSTGVFTCRVAGSYYIRYDLQVLSRRDRTAYAGVQLLHNGAPVTWSYKLDADFESNAAGVIGNGLVLQLNKGDTVKVQAASQSYFYWKNRVYSSTFSGYLLK